LREKEVGGKKEKREMTKINKLEYDENRVKMYGPGDVIKEMMAKVNEIIDVVNKGEKREKEKMKRADTRGEGEKRR
jgi:hypothetical protein